MSQQHKILIVDDDHDTHQFIADLLQSYGYEATCVHSSATARELIPREIPDFLILDLHIDQRYAGWLLLQELHTHPTTAAIPVLLMTSDGEFVHQHRNEVRALGGEVLQKPFELDHLIKRVQARLEAA